MPLIANSNDFIHTHSRTHTHTHIQWDHPNLVMVVYDVTNEQSLKSCSKWIERVKAQKVAPELQLPG